jgi:hypothetical protein
MMPSISLWRTDAAPCRYYLLPDGVTIAPGDVQLRGPCGRRQTLCRTALQRFEIGEAQALRWARAQLGDTLDELREGVDRRLVELRAAVECKQRTPVARDTRATPDAGPALLHLLRQLPSVIANSLSNDPGRLESAKAGMRTLHRRLKDAGIDLDERFSGFPDRLAGLRDEVDKARDAGKKPPGQS